MTDTPDTDVNAYKHAQRKPKGPLKLTWRHKAFAREYVAAGLPEDATSIVMRVGLANDPHSAARSARNYLQRAEMQSLIATALQDSGITEGGIREVVKRWMWHEDGNLALRAAELAAKLLGLLREPVPAVPQLPPLIVVQAAPQAITSGDSLPADYTVEASIGTREEPIPAGPPLISVEQTGPETPVEARSSVAPQKTRGRPLKASKGTEGAVSAKRITRPSRANGTGNRYDRLNDE